MEVNIDNTSNDEAFLQKLSHATNIHIERITINIKLDITLNDLDNEMKLDDNYLYVINFSNQTISNYNVYYSVDISNNVEDRIFNILNKNSLFIENHSQLFLKLKPFDHTSISYSNSSNTQQKKQKIMIKLIKIHDNIKKEAKNIEIYNNLISSPESSCIFVLYKDENNERIITDEFCEEIIDFFDKYPEKETEYWTKGSNVNCKCIRLNDMLVFDEVNNKISMSINKIINIISIKQQDLNVRANNYQGCSIRKIYGPTRCHTDGITKTNTELFFKNSLIRNCSLVIGLNDDYDGGEFYFPNQKFKHKLKKGEIILFPPYWTHPHFTFPLLNRTYRYTINTWLLEEDEDRD